MWRAATPRHSFPHILDFKTEFKRCHPCERSKLNHVSRHKIETSSLSADSLPRPPARCCRGLSRVPGWWHFPDLVLHRWSSMLLHVHLLGNRNPWPNNTPGLSVSCMLWFQVQSGHLQQLVQIIQPRLRESSCWVIPPTKDAPEWYMWQSGHLVARGFIPHGVQRASKHGHQGWSFCYEGHFLCPASICAPHQRGCSSLFSLLMLIYGDIIVLIRMNHTPLQFYRVFTVLSRSAHIFLWC